MFQLHDLQFWIVVSEKPLSILLNSIGPVWVGSMVILLGQHRRAVNVVRAIGVHMGETMEDFMEEVRLSMSEE